MARNLPPPTDLQGMEIELDGERLVVLSYPVSSTPSLPSCLSSAEQAVVQLACEGFAGLEIAAARQVSYRTVCNQLASVYRKLGVSSRESLIARLLQGRDGQ